MLAAAACRSLRWRWRAPARASWRCVANRGPRRRMSTGDTDRQQIERLARVLESDDGEDPTERLEGAVQHVAEGVAHVAGVLQAPFGSVLRFEGDQSGIVLGLHESIARVALLRGAEGVRVGQRARFQARDLEVPTGPALIGRVVNVLGEPIDDCGPLDGSWRRAALHGPVPSVAQRRRVSEPVFTGIKAIDIFQPMARGLRYAMFGPKGSGKSGLAMDVVGSQQYSHTESEYGVFCVYVAIDQSAREIGRIVSHLESIGAMNYTTVVAAESGESDTFKFLAPFTGCAMGNYFRDRGLHSLVVYDNLSHHALAHERLAKQVGPSLHSLQYLHARLVDHAAAISPDYGGGSASAMCLVSSQMDGSPTRVAEAIATFVDEVVALDSGLAKAGCWPPINVASVVRNPAPRFQPPLTRDVRQLVHQQLVQHAQLCEDAKFASKLGLTQEEEILPLISGPEKMQQLLLQNGPQSLVDQIIGIATYAEGHILDVDATEVARYEEGVIAYTAKAHPQLYHTLASLSPSQRLDPELWAELCVALEQYHRKFPRDSPVPAI